MQQTAGIHIQSAWSGEIKVLESHPSLRSHPLKNVGKMRK